MTFSFKRLAAVLGLAALATTPIPTGFEGGSAGAAYAKGGGGGGGNGGGGGSSSSSSGKSSSSKGASGGNGGGRSKGGSGGGSTSRKKVTSGSAAESRKPTVAVIGGSKKVVSAEIVPKKRPAALETEVAETEITTKGHGALASELKGMNAVHANPNALANASPNSQVGRIATYQTAALATLAAADATADAIAERETALTTLTGATDALAAYDAGYTGRSRTDVEGDIAALDPAAADYDAQLAALNTELETVATYEAGRIDLETAEATAKADYDTALLAELAAAKAAEEATVSEEEALLAATGGRELSDEAIAYVRAELGLDPAEEDAEETVTE